MEQHPVPRQITSFEFKLIGFMTLKQFIYLVVFFPLAFVVYTIFPIPLINILLAALVAGLGAALAFLPVNERPLDVWIKNFIRRLTSPTQYVYQKQNPPIYFLKNLFFVQDPHHVLAHIESQEKLAAYMAKNQVAKPSNVKKQTINELLANPPKTSEQPTAVAIAPTMSSSISNSRQPFFTGVVRNHRMLPLPGILIYLKDDQGKTLRLLKTNPHGVFATFGLLPPKDYVFEIKDPRNTYFFDTMKVRLEGAGVKPLEFYSKELL